MEIKLKNINGITVYEDEYTNVRVEAVGMKMSDGTISNVLTVLKSDVPCGSIEFAMSDLDKRIDTLKNFGVSLTEQDILGISRGVRKDYEKIPVIPYVNGYGWQRKDDEIQSYVGVEHISLDGKKLPQVITSRSLIANGDISLLTSVLTDYLKNEKRQAVVCASLASVICGYLKENLLISLVGMTSTGKSTATDLAVSLFTGIKAGITKMKFNATENAIIKKLGNNNGIPVIIDDTSLSKIKDMTTLIYQVAEGCDRDRLNNKAEMQEVAEWATSIFFTGEKTILFSGNNQLKGKAGRLIEINVADNDLFDNGSDAKYIKKIYTDNYGLIGNYFVNWLINEKILDNLENLIMEHMEKTITYLDTLEIKDNEGIIDRLSRKIAIITVTAELANSAFKFNMNVDNIRQYLSNVCVENINTFDELNEDTFNFKATYEKFLESIAEVAETKPEHTNVLFVSSKDFKKHSQQIIDNVDVIKNMKEWKNYLKQNNCLETKGDDFGYRDASVRMYGLRKPEVSLND